MEDGSLVSTESRNCIVVADEPSIATRKYDERLKVTANERHRKILQTTIDHTMSEALCDLDGTMRALVADPEYLHFYGPPNNTVRRGWDAARDYYVKMFANGGLGNVAEIVNHRLIVDDNALATESTIIRLLPWRRAKAAGYAIDDERGHYAVRHRLCGTIPFDSEGLMCGELSYGGPADPLHFEFVPDELLSPGYLAWVDEFASDR